MELQNTREKSRLPVGITIGVVLLILAGVATSMAFLMVSVVVMGCVKGPPEWVYYIVFLGFPIPLIAVTIIVPYLYINRQRVIWMLFTPIAGLFLSCLIFFIWFLILTQYC